MLIWIKYTNQKYDMVKHTMLDNLLSSNKVEKFYRSDGWACVGIDKIRGAGGRPYGGPERRSIESPELNYYRVGFCLGPLAGRRNQ